MVEIKSPIRVKDLEGKAGVVFKALLGIEGTKKELYDNERLLVINLKKGESIAFLDKQDSIWELYKNKRGKYYLKKLKIVQLTDRITYLRKMIEFMKIIKT